MIKKLVNDEDAAFFAAEVTDGEHIELSGVSICLGKHPINGLSIVISPLMGDHLIITNPFAGRDVSS